MMGIPTKEWYDIPSTGLIFFQTSSQEVLNIHPSIDEDQNVSSHNKKYYNIIRVGYTILSAETEAGTDENWCLLENLSTYNAFINIKYMSKIRDAPDGQYLYVHCNTGETYTKNIGELPGYSNTIYYNPKGVSNIL